MVKIIFLRNNFVSPNAGDITYILYSGYPWVHKSIYLSSLNNVRTITLIHYYTDSTPTLATLSMLKTSKGKIQVIKRVAPYWRKLGALLDFDDDGTQLDTIKQKFHSDPEDCCQEMFKYWVKGNGVKPCTWNKLIELLDDNDQKALSKEIQESLSS